MPRWEDVLYHTLLGHTHSDDTVLDIEALAFLG